MAWHWFVMRKKTSKEYCLFSEAASCVNYVMSLPDGSRYTVVQPMLSRY